LVNRVVALTEKRGSIHRQTHNQQNKSLGKGLSVTCFC